MSEVKKLKLTKIVLETKDGKQVELSIEDAEELHEQLNTLFGEKTTYIPSMPIVIERDRWNPPYYPYWCDVTYMNDAPKLGGLDVKFSISGNSGLSVSYCGDAL